ncbi:serpin family protein [Brachybacterium paraconglomeratum]|uniref:serpin family protein n=1 Tax=Brachybacterium paraconglomeratum TaxID=173362 RepID=UPI0031EB9563
MATIPPSPRTELKHSLVRRRTVLAGASALPLAAVNLAACTPKDAFRAEPNLSAELPRAEPGPAEGAGSRAAPFTARMLGAIDRAEVNAVCSPLSAQVALIMAGMGAAGSTRAQMEEVLGGSMEELAEDANTLSQLLATVGDAERKLDDDEAPEPARASLVNGTWLQEGFEVQQAYLEDLATWFGSGLFEADFTDDATREGAREGINDWVAESTNDLIEELLPEGILTADTRLVLVNALHLKAAWPEELTKGGGTFTTAGGEERSTEMLHGSTSTWYEDETCRATTLGTYGEDLALALVQPVGELAEVLDVWAEAAPEPGSGLAALLSGLEASQAATQLTVPAFDIAWESSLKGTLESLGMTDAFGSGADFSGITGAPDLVIDEVVQKAVITIDEQGMEAAAATAVIMTETSAQMPDQELVLDSPFLFIAYERTSLAPLVVGWIGDPTQTR